MQAATLHDRIRREVDDELAVRTTPERVLRVLTRAQEWVAIRYQLLRHTLAVPLMPHVAWYDLFTLQPRLVTVTHVAVAGLPLAPVPLRVLRYTQPHWLSHVGVPRHYYRMGLRYLGIHPHPMQAGWTALVTGCLAPLPLLAATQDLEVPDSYVAHVVLAAVALLMIGQEKHEQESVQRLAHALTLEAVPHKPKSEEGDAHATR